MMRRSFVVSVLIIGMFFLVSVGSAFFFTIKSYREVKGFQFDAAKTSAQYALLVAKPLDECTLHAVASLHLWRVALTSIEDAALVSTQLKIYLPLALETDPHASVTAQELHTSLAHLTQDLNQIEATGEHSFIYQHFLLPTITTQLHSKKISEIASQISTLSDHFLSGKHRYVVLFQNSDELRATGGFIGSYAIIEFNNGAVSELNIQDIYEADGQFSGFVEAPHGVKEYLSSGKGLRLPDANWQPDFQSSAKTILNFFALGSQKNVEGIAAVNLSVAENILKVIGPISLPEYKTTVTADNLAEVARSDRSQFFPGSQQKRNFLSALFVQIKIRFMNASTSQQKEIINQLITGLETKDVQLYSNDQQIENIAIQNNLAGSWVPQQNTFFLGLIESNVGINKVNRDVQRKVEMHIIDPTNLEVTTHFQNANETLDYINYQRVFVLPTTNVQRLQVGAQVMTTWNEELISLANGQQLKQIGFLVPVASKSATTATVALHDPLLTQGGIQLMKQSGVSAIPYLIQFPTQVKNILLDQDSIISP